ncbi:nitrogen regulation protein NR(I) [Pseudoxanthomonas winnipegensis]|uniref:DNA-binding transcriptional regulator NtrC n=1 Tax=Pseudoxanthomonas winnipegensis TaxID=2480810 RepID=A0A4Q8LMX0_9GAMM|nr:nitrogen regulation protein NR(I) [Pseudoxanthomonas winnipegensis]RZZ84080.1 nitrogen regulation protein NR(I) [Pseudoxanthomonas winnipegensis]TAA32223.1 nitrogen regulation protein NR(I) [Pseudoxanthomonas winnipegensis]
MPTEESQRIWVVDDDRSVRFVLATALRDAGYDVDGFDSAASALQALGTRGVPDLLFTDVRMPGEDGLKLLDRLKHAHPSLPVIVMSAYTDVASTAGAFRGGAQEFLSKPFDLDDAVALAARALPSLEPSEAAVAEPVAETRNGTPELIGDTPAMRALFRAIGRLAQAPLSVLVTGETGTGKELVARALHNESPRARKPFVALNTAAIPAELLESELFGHEAGAFTGAQRRHIGRFEQADGGTLFLDEIGDMPLPLQTRLLRVLAEGEFFRVGGRELIRVDVRVIAATHQDLEGLVQAGRFRADLLHRLDVVRLQLPPLRERRGDVSRLAENFLAQACAKLGMPAKRVAPSAREALRAHDWPGNVRELENVCWRLAALAPSDTITVGDVEQALPHGARSSTRDAADWDALLGQWARARLAEGADGLHAEARTRLDRALLEAALQFTNGRRADAAARLGVGRNTITRKLGSGRRRS